MQLVSNVIPWTSRAPIGGNPPDLGPDLNVLQDKAGPVSKFIASVASALALEGVVASFHSHDLSGPPEVIGFAGAWIGSALAAEVAKAAAGSAHRGSNTPSAMTGVVFAHGAFRDVARIVVPVGSPTSAVVISFFVGSQSRDLGAINRFGPAVAGFFNLWRANRLQGAENAAFSTASDALDMGVLLIGADGQIMHANRAALALMKDARCLRACHSSFTACRLDDALAIQVALRHALAENKATKVEGAIPSAPTLLVHSADMLHRLLVQIIPVEAAAREAGQSAATVYIVDPQLEISDRLEPVCRLHGLTPIETRLVGHLSGGKSLLESAGAMRIKEQTARGYLKQVFLKTGTHRQAELVKTMLLSMMHLHHRVAPTVFA